jgi:2',3'-cyclic-nucleotide 2'-phosphodiesterase (5'-nucleotidase family)
VPAPLAIVQLPLALLRDCQIFHDNMDWYREQAIHIIDIMNRIGYDAMTLGNHELAPVGLHTREALELAQFPLLASNVEID